MDGPDPKRPSAGFKESGMMMSEMFGAVVTYVSMAAMQWPGELAPGERVEEVVADTSLTTGLRR